MSIELITPWDETLATELDPLTIADLEALRYRIEQELEYRLSDAISERSNESLAEFSISVLFDEIAVLSECAQKLRAPDAKAGVATIYEHDREVVREELHRRAQAGDPQAIEWAGRETAFAASI